MFGRRRHAAVLAAARVPQLTEAQILDLVSSKLGEFVGANGEWTVSRRAADDTDSIFQDVLTQSMAVSITTVIVAAKRALENGEPLPSGGHAAAPDQPIRAASSHGSRAGRAPQVASAGPPSRGRPRLAGQPVVANARSCSARTTSNNALSIFPW